MSILTFAASTVAFAQVDPAALVEQHRAAIARGDVAGALALYTDDAVIDAPGRCAATPCVGKVAIQQELESRVAVNNRATAIKNYVSDNVVTSQFEVRNDATQKAGVERVILWVIYVMKGDKIASVYGIPERTDPQTARFLEWQRAQPPAR